MPVIIFPTYPDPADVRLGIDRGDLILGTYSPDLPVPSTVLQNVVYGDGDPGGPLTGTLVTYPAPPAPLTGVMNFRVVNQAIIDTLGASAGGQFVVVGFRRQKKSAEEIRNNKRTVQSFFQDGKFSKAGGRQTGPVQHDLTFNISLSVSAASRINLDAITNPVATQTDIKNAISAMTEASAEADNLLDELIELVYQILMDGRNLDLGLPVGTVASRWVDNIRKDDPLPQGSLVVLTGVIQFTCRTFEAPTGDTGTVANNVTTAIDMPGDTVQKTTITAN